MRCRRRWLGADWDSLQWRLLTHDLQHLPSRWGRYQRDNLTSAVFSGTMGNKVSLEEEMINLRIVSKQMARSSKKCEKNEKLAVEKLKKVRSSWSTN